jgi:peptidoglycan/xylan/chitin deacetylase (PgdA/CDA1 family)
MTKFDDDWNRVVIEPARRRYRRLRAQRVRRRRRAAAAIVAAAGALILIVAEAGAFRHGGRASAPAAAAATSKAPTSAAHESEATRERRAINRVLTYTPFIREGRPRKREVALTFDDGPGPYTPQVLRILREHHVTATFFEVGLMLPSFNHSTTEQTHHGYAIGDHTYDHPHMEALTKTQQAAELKSTATALKRYGAPYPRLFRPPYGSFDRDTIDLLHRQRMLMVLWSTDTEDYTDPGADAIAERALAGAHPGAIILLHDAGGDRSQTLTALPKIIRGLRKRHLRPVTIPKLVLDDPPPRHQRIPWDLAGGS